MIVILFLDFMFWIFEIENIKYYFKGYFWKNFEMVVVVLFRNEFLN